MKPEELNSTSSVTISDSEKLESLIERKRKNLEAIFDAVPVGLLLVDEDLVVVRVNDAIRKLVGKEFTEIINKPLGQALSCENITIEKKLCGTGDYCQKCPLRQNVLKAFQTSQSVNGIELQSETHFRNRSVKPWFALNVELVVIDDKRYAVVCLNDITERKLAEEKLAETMAMKQQFISTVSHELRTPLTAIREGINIVLEGVAGRVKKKQKEFLELSKRNVDRLSMLINDVLDFQKLESGRMKFDFIKADIIKVAKEAAETMTLMAKKADVSLMVEIEPEICRFMFDRNKIIQVLTNLLSNAIKFTPAGGKVVLKIQQQTDEVVITVSDTGMGIPKDDLSKIFERFYRVRRQGKEIQGTGLGLPIVAQIINCHGGRIMVESELNKGTAFTVLLPQKPPTDLELDRNKDEIIEKTITQ